MLSRSQNGEQTVQLSQLDKLITREKVSSKIKLPPLNYINYWGQPRRPAIQNPELKSVFKNKIQSTMITKMELNGSTGTERILDKIFSHYLAPWVDDVVPVLPFYP